MEPSNRESDAGWNDPPSFSYSESAQYSKSPKRYLFSKRIAFPLNLPCNSNLPSIDPTATANFNPNLPPPPPVGVGFSNVNAAKALDACSSSESEPITCDIKSEDESLGSGSADESCLSRVLRNLNDVIEEKSELSENSSVNEQIRKKLQIMEDSWKSKLSQDIKRKLSLLSEALKNHDERTADEIHVSLMVDYPKLCSEFISAFRQLINRMKLINPSTDSEPLSSTAGLEVSEMSST